MELKTTGIVLHVQRYSDKNSIVHVLTRERGRISITLPIGKSRRTLQRSALFSTLAVIDMDISYNPSRTIHTIKDVRILDFNTDIRLNPYKNTIAIFLAEVISRVVLANEETHRLFDFVRYSISVLEHIDMGVANFHICFMYKLATFLGIQPDVSTYSRGCCFSLSEGVFMPMNFGQNSTLHPDLSSVILRLDRMNYRNMHLFRFNRDQRAELLEMMLRYYTLHSISLTTLKSPKILRQIFQ